VARPRARTARRGCRNRRARGLRCDRELGAPIDDRYTFVIVALGAIFAGAGLAGWRSLAPSHPRRRLWQAGALLCAAAIVGFIPWNVKRLHATFDSSKPAQQSLSAQLRVETT